MSYKVVETRNFIIFLWIFSLGMLVVFLSYLFLRYGGLDFVYNQFERKIVAYLIIMMVFFVMSVLILKLKWRGVLYGAYYTILSVVLAIILWITPTLLASMYIYFWLMQLIMFLLVILLTLYIFGCNTVTEVYFCLLGVLASSWCMYIFFIFIFLLGYGCCLTTIDMGGAVSFPVLHIAFSNILLGFILNYYYKLDSFFRVFSFNLVFIFISALPALILGLVHL